VLNIEYLFLGSYNRYTFLYNKTNRRTNFQIYSGTKLYMFRAVSLPIIRNFPLYISALAQVIQTWRQLACSIRMELQFHP